MIPIDKIPWQMRHVIMWPQAFVMTIIEAYFSPWDYFEKLELKNEYFEPLAFSTLNAMILAWPLVQNPLSQTSWLIFGGILIWVNVWIIGMSFGIHQGLRIFRQKVDFYSCLYILAFSTPVVWVSMIPHWGYGLAAIGLFLFAGVGFFRRLREHFRTLLFVLVLTPGIVLMPYAVLAAYVNMEQQGRGPDANMLAQNMLAVTAVAAEQHALKNNGRYPMDSAILVAENYLKEDYCGREISGYLITCELQNYGYILQAKPQGFQGRGLPKYIVTTGGALRTER